jgi:hypothetical protein
MGHSRRYGEDMNTKYEFDLGLGVIRMMAIILVIVLGIMLTTQPIFLAVVVTTIISIALLGWKKGEVKNGS